MEPLWLLQLPEALGVSGSDLRTFHSGVITLFSVYNAQYMHATTNAVTKHNNRLHHKCIHKLAAAVLTTAPEQQTRSVLVCFLLCFVSIWTLHNCWGRERTERKKERTEFANCWRPVATSIPPLPLLQPIVQRGVEVARLNYSLNVYHLSGHRAVNEKWLY